MKPIERKYLEIRQFRKDVGLTQAGLGAQLRVTQSAIGHWECGRAKPDARCCLALERLSGGKLDRLLLRPDIFGEVAEAAA